MIYLDGTPCPPTLVASALHAAGCPDWAVLAYLGTAEFAGRAKREDYEEVRVSRGRTKGERRVRRKGEKKLRPVPPWWDEEAQPTPSAPETGPSLASQEVSHTNQTAQTTYQQALAGVLLAHEKVRGKLDPRSFRRPHDVEDVQELAEVAVAHAREGNAGAALDILHEPVFDMDDRVRRHYAPLREAVERLPGGNVSLPPLTPSAAPPQSDIHDLRRRINSAVETARSLVTASREFFTSLLQRGHAILERTGDLPGEIVARAVSVFEGAVNRLVEYMRPVPMIPTGRLNDMLEAGLTMVSPGRAQRYRQAAARVFAALPPHVSARIEQNLAGGFHFYEDRHALRSDGLAHVINLFSDTSSRAFDTVLRKLRIVAWSGGSPYTLPEIDRMASTDEGRHRIVHIVAREIAVAWSQPETQPAAFFSPMDASVHLDGGGDLRMKDETTYRYQGDALPAAYAHEFGHAIDGSDNELSGSFSWGVAWRGEILGKKAKLTEYAQSSASEGFAEFARAVYASGVPLEQVERDFPVCSAFFRWHRLWPESSPNSSPRPSLAPALA